MYIKRSPMLHIIDENIRYQIVKWLKNMSAKHVWNMLRLCWIDVYLKPFDYIHHDADKNFMNQKFRQYCSIMNIVIKTMPVEIHWSIEIVEKYHSIFRRTYLMIIKNLIATSMIFTEIIKKIKFQITIKIVNDIIDDNDLIFTLLIFDAYFRMQKLDSSFSIIIQKIEVIRKIINEIRIIRTERQINDALNIRNESIIDYLHDLSLNSKIFVWKKNQSNRSNKWIEFFNFLNMKNEICKIDMLYNFIDFRNTIIKSYYRTNIKDNENTAVASNDEQMFSNEKKTSNDQKKIIDHFSKFQNTKVNATALNATDFGAIIFSAIDFGAIIFRANTFNAIAFDVFNRTKSEKILQSSSIKRFWNRFQKQSIIQLKNQSNLSIFLLNKIDSLISSLRIFYAKSRKKKINELLNKKIFDVLFLIEMFSEIKLFNFRFVDKIKNSKISTAFEKFRLMIQIFNDQKKNDYDSIIYNSTYKSTFDTDFNCNHQSRIISLRYFSSIRSINYFVDQKILYSSFDWIRIKNRSRIQND